MMALHLNLTKAVGLVNHLIKRLPVKSQLRCASSTPPTTPASNAAPTADDDDPEMNKPIQYSTSPAAQWAARHSFAGVKDDDMPWFQPHIVTVSSVIFIIYFLYLREPNDIDAIFDRELGDYFDTDDTGKLKKKLQYNTEVSAAK